MRRITPAERAELDQADFDIEVARLMRNNDATDGMEDDDMHDDDLSVSRGVLLAAGIGLALIALVVIGGEL